MLLARLKTCKWSNQSEKLPLVHVVLRNIEVLVESWSVIVFCTWWAAAVLAGFRGRNSSYSIRQRFRNMPWQQVWGWNNLHSQSSSQTYTNRPKRWVFNALYLLCTIHLPMKRQNVCKMHKVIRWEMQSRRALRFWLATGISSISTDLKKKICWHLFLLRVVDKNVSLQ